MREMAPTRVGQVTGDGTWRLRGARRLTRSRATETRGPVQPACCALASLAGSRRQALQRPGPPSNPHHLSHHPPSRPSCTPQFRGLRLTITATLSLCRPLLKRRSASSGTLQESFLWPAILSRLGFLISCHFSCPSANSYLLVRNRRAQPNNLTPCPRRPPLPIAVVVEFELNRRP
jgi:hypothetical protein